MTAPEPDASEIGASVHRHPSGRRARAELVELELARRVAASLGQQHARWPAVAAAALAARGTHRLSRVAFATQLGVDPDHLAAVETGQCPPVEVPLPLQRSDPYGALLAGLERSVLTSDPDGASVQIWHEDRPP